jgi:hypothetical protein
MDNIEMRIADYLLKHKDGIKQTIFEMATESKYNPILRTYFRDAVVNEVVQVLTQALNSSYIEIASIVDLDYLEALLGKEFFEC